MNWIDDTVRELHYGLPIDLAHREELIKFVETALTEAHSKGTQEALAKVEEWVNLVKNEWFASKADTFAGQSECEHEADRLFAKISTYLQQLKDNKTV